MGFGTTRVERRSSIVKPQVSFILGGAIAAAAAVVGCGDEAATPLVAIAGSSASGATAGSSGSDNATSGSATGGNGTSGSNASAGNAGTTTGTAGNIATGGNAGSAGSTTTAGASGSAGTGGAAGTAGNGGSAGGAVCPAGGSGGTPIADPTGDSDSDGIANCLDGCPDDSAKTEAGVCGCGIADTDTDGDGSPDCNDDCDNDATKTLPGVCGCGMSDTANADNDAAVDCKDACPNDPALTEAGACGCLPDSLGARCLAHRYQFDGTGAVATDSIAGATGNGTVVGATLSGTGTVVLAGGTSDQYIKLPAGLISKVGNSATIEAWVTWAGTGGDWQRIFDFGSSDAGEGMQGNGNGYLFLTPRAGGGNLRVAISAAGGGADEDLVTTSAPLPTTLTHVAVVVDGATDTLSLYQDGVLQGTPATIRPTTTLTGLKDVNNWLGRSQYQSDEEVAATYHELRIYSRALDATQVKAGFTAGPDTLP